MRGFVVAAEGDLIGKRMIGTEAKKETVLPVLLEAAVTLRRPERIRMIMPRAVEDGTFVYTPRGSG